jgi:hypothetical protein
LAAFRELVEQEVSAYQESAEQAVSVKSAFPESVE